MLPSENSLSASAKDLHMDSAAASTLFAKGCTPLVVVGQKAVAGETVIADLQSDEAQRKGNAR